MLHVEVITRGGEPLSPRRRVGYGRANAGGGSWPTVAGRPSLAARHPSSAGNTKGEPGLARCVSLARLPLTPGDEALYLRAFVEFGYVRDRLSIGRIPHARSVHFWAAYPVEPFAVIRKV